MANEYFIYIFQGNGILGLELVEVSFRFDSLLPSGAMVLNDFFQDLVGEFTKLEDIVALYQASAGATTNQAPIENLGYPPRSTGRVVSWLGQVYLNQSIQIIVDSISKPVCRSLP